jgi:SAM-dependent methyltransferase
MIWNRASLRWIAEVKARLRRGSFRADLFGLLLHPGFIIRRGLWSNVAHLAPSLRGRILDLGCGSRPYECLFVNADGYVGLDVQQSGHDHTNSKIDVFYDGETIPFGRGEFDAVVSFEVFEHVFNLDRVLSEINRVLRDDGKLLITVPFFWPEHEQPYDFARYTSFGIQAALEKGGFRTACMVKSGNFIAALWQAYIGYLFSFSPKKSLLGRGIFQLLVIFPTTLFGLLASTIFPKRYEAYCNLVVLAEKQPGSSAAIDPR